MSTRRTKIVCTIGPASRDEATLRAMIHAGMDVARINFSYGTHGEHACDIGNVRQIAQEEGTNVAVMADLQGPKLRIGALDQQPLRLGPGDGVALTTRPSSGRDNVVNLPHQQLISAVEVGQTLLLGDGALEFMVERKDPQELCCKVVVGGELSSHNGVVAPGVELPGQAITQKDREDASFALEQGADFLALSFVCRAADVEELRSLIRNQAGEKDGLAIVAKIEKREALQNFEEILETVNAVMVARGDLGMEVSVQEVPLHQKELIRKCNRVGKPVITATQMLQSMTENPRPTRAETSDVANAIIDGTDAVMLSGETAIGRYPVGAVEMMAKIAATVEGEILPRMDEMGFAKLEHLHPITDAISHAACIIARDVGAGLLAVSTWSGYTARQVARERPKQPIVAFTPNEVTHRRLALTWGVTPLLIPSYKSTDEVIEAMASRVLELELAEAGDLVVITGGLPLAGEGRTNFLKVHRL